MTEAALQTLSALNVDGEIGAGFYRRDEGCPTHRSGYRDHELRTEMVALNLQVPKLRRGLYVLRFFDLRRSSDKALMAVSREATIGGFSTQKVHDPVQALGLSGIFEGRDDHKR